MFPCSSLRGLTLTSALLMLFGGCQGFRGKTSKQPLVADLPSVRSSADHELPPSDAAALCAATAKNLESNGDDFGAIMMYERARAKDPDGMSSVCRQLAVLYDRTGNYTKALAEYKRALEVNPKDAEMLNNLGYCHYSNGRWDLAEESFRKALALDGNYGRAWVNLGLTLGQKQQYDDALGAFSKAVGPAEAHSNLAFVYLTQGKKNEARAEYQLAINLDPSLRLASLAVARLDREGRSSSITEVTEQPNTVSNLALAADPETPLMTREPTSHVIQAASTHEPVADILQVNFQHGSVDAPLGR